MTQASLWLAALTPPANWGGFASRPQAANPNGWSPSRYSVAGEVEANEALRVHSGT